MSCRYFKVERRNIRGAMKERVKSGLGLTIGADIEEEEDTGETLMDEDDNTENVMDETAAEDTGPPPGMVKLTARHFNLKFKDDDELFNATPNFDTKICEQKFDLVNKKKNNKQIHKKEKETNFIEETIKPKLSKTELTYLRVKKFRKLKKMRKEKAKADNKLGSNFGSTLRENSKTPNYAEQEKLQGNIQKAKRLDDSVANVLNAVDFDCLDEDVSMKEPRDVKCNQCGELFDSFQTLDVHKFQNTC